MKDLYDAIRVVPDFPKKGILFRDITPLLKDPAAFSKALSLLAAETPAEATKIVAIESRGFIFGGALAALLKKGFVPIRKVGKLPYKTINHTYALEYGTDTVEMHEDALTGGEKVVLIDDVLATGGTAEAACKLIERAGASVAKILFLIELKDLDGRKRIQKYNVFSLLAV
jgi:adenine phosphoribosyltransferase